MRNLYRIAFRIQWAKLALTCVFTISSFLMSTMKADAACPTDGYALSTFVFPTYQCQSGGPGGGGGGGFLNVLDKGIQNSQHEVVGTHLTVQMHQLRIVPGGGSEYFVIKQKRADYKYNYGGLYTPMKSIKCETYQGSPAYWITSLQPYLWVPGMSRVAVGSAEITYTPIGTIYGPDLEHVLTSTFTYGLRLKHTSACVEVYGCTLFNSVVYETFLIQNNGSPFDGNGVVQRVSGFVTRNMISPIVEAQHGISATPLGRGPDPLPLTPPASNILDIEFYNHHYYEIGCTNCLEGCFNLVPQCLPYCPGPFEDSNWMVTNNVISMTPQLSEEKNYYKIYHLPTTNTIKDPDNPPSCVDLSGVRNPSTLGESSWKTCKGFVEGTPCTCIPPCVECNSFDDANTTWPVSLKFNPSSLYDQYYPGPWVCTRMVLTPLRHAYVPWERIAIQFTEDQLTAGNNYNTDVDSYCGSSACGLLVGPPQPGDNFYHLERAGVARYSGYWLGWNCGGGYMQIPASVDRIPNKWYATNSTDFSVNECWRSNSPPFYVEAVTVWSYKEAQKVLVGKVLNNTWVRMVHSAALPTPFSTATVGPSTPLPATPDYSCIGAQRTPDTRERSLARRDAGSPIGVPTDPTHCNPP